MVLADDLQEPFNRSLISDQQNLTEIGEAQFDAEEVSLCGERPQCVHGIRVVSRTGVVAKIENRAKTAKVCSQTSR